MGSACGPVDVRRVRRVRGKEGGEEVTGGEYLLWGVWGGGRAMGFMVGQVA